MYEVRTSQTLYWLRYPRMKKVSFIWDSRVARSTVGHVSLDPVCFVDHRCILLLQVSNTTGRCVTCDILCISRSRCHPWWRRGPSHMSLYYHIIVTAYVLRGRFTPYSQQRCINAKYATNQTFDKMMEQDEWGWEEVHRRCKHTCIITFQRGKPTKFA